MLIRDVSSEICSTLARLYNSLMRDTELRETVTALQDRVSALESLHTVFSLKDGPDAIRYHVLSDYFQVDISPHKLDTRINELYEHLGLERVKTPAKVELVKKGKRQ